MRNIIQVSAGGIHTVGLKSDGTVVAVGYNRNGQCEVSDWNMFLTLSLISPRNNEVGVSLTPVFSWTTIPNAEKYELSVWDVASNTIVLKEDVEGTSYVTPLGMLSENRAYRWGVRALSAGKWISSVQQRFRTGRGLEEEWIRVAIEKVRRFIREIEG